MVSNGNQKIFYKLGTTCKNILKVKTIFLHLLDIKLIQRKHQLLAGHILHNEVIAWPFDGSDKPLPI